LSALAAEPTRVFTKEELLRDVWGFRAMGSTRTIDSHALGQVRESSLAHSAPHSSPRHGLRSSPGPGG
jgi:DNA-binding response OmpR family regulator